MSPQERKQRSEELLSSIGVDINPSLPAIEEDESTIRSAEEIARRAICLTAVVSRAAGDGKAFLIEYLKRKSCYEHLTPEELAFLGKAKLTKQDEARFSWQVEALRVLLWSIGYGSLSVPGFQQCNPHEDVYPNCSSASNDGSNFIREAKLLSKEALLNLSDLVYRAHWATRQYSLDKSTRIGSLDSGVVLEYHRAINWITCYEKQEWDEVTTDT